MFAIVSAWAHSRGVRLLRCLDDWLVLASSEAKARQHVHDLLSLCHSLGITLNDKKSELAPSRSVEYLGMTINTVTARAFPTAARVDKLLSIARRFLAHQSPHAQLWQVLLGHMSSLEKLVPCGRLRMRSLQWQLKAHWFPETDPPRLLVPRSWQVEEDLAWWVDEENPPARGKTLRDTDTRPPPVLGRVPIGMGSSPPRPISFEDMVTGKGPAAHQPSRNESPVPRPSGVQGPSHRPPSDCNVRQLDSVGLCQQAGGHGLRHPLFVDRATYPMVGVQQSPARSEVLAGAVQHPGRPPQLPEPGSGGRVVTPSTGSEEAHMHVGISHTGLVRHSPKCEVAPVLLSDPGSSSPLRGRLPSPPQQPRHLRVPSLSSGRKGRGSSQRDPKSLDDSGRPSLAGEGVVRRPPPPPNPTTAGTAAVGLAATTTTLQLVPRRCPRPEPSLVATLKRLLRKSAFREELRSRCPAASESPPHAYTSRNGSLSVVGVVEGASLQLTPLYL